MVILNFVTSTNVMVLSSKPASSVNNDNQFSFLIINFYHPDNNNTK